MSVNVSNYNSKIRVLTIDKPPVNALDDEVIRGFTEAVQLALSDLEVLALVITGSGKFFAAGADVEKLAICNGEEGADTVGRVKALHDLMRSGSKPIIAAINGIAAGGGLELAMACDIRIAGKAARLGLPEATLGVIPGAGGTQILPRLVGMGKALELMLSGRLIAVEEAFRCGLVDCIADEGKALEEALNLAEKITANAPLALAEIKQAAYDTLNLSLEEGLKHETERFARVCDTEDKEEGISAFKTRRSPNFKGR